MLLLLLGKTPTFLTLCSCSYSPALVCKQVNHKKHLNEFRFLQGAGSVPQSVQLEKQQALIKQLKHRLNLQVDDEDLANTSVDDLKSRVDDAVAEVTCFFCFLLENCLMFLGHKLIDRLILTNISNIIIKFITNCIKER